MISRTIEQQQDRDSSLCLDWFLSLNIEYG